MEGPILGRADKEEDLSEEFIRSKGLRSGKKPAMGRPVDGLNEQIERQWRSTLSVDHWAWYINCPRFGLDGREGRDREGWQVERGYTLQGLGQHSKKGVGGGFIPNEIKNH